MEEDSDVGLSLSHLGPAAKPEPSVSGATAKCLSIPVLAVSTEQRYQLDVVIMGLAKLNAKVLMRDAEAASSIFRTNLLSSTRWSLYAWVSAVLGLVMLDALSIQGEKPSFEFDPVLMLQQKNSLFVGNNPGVCAGQSVHFLLVSE